jgi:site-specific recombinase XerD
MSSDFRTQFINHMTLQRFSPHTQKNYTLAMKGFCRFFNQPPDTLTQEHVQKYLLYLVNEKKLSWGAVNNIIAGISCFYKNILKWDETKFKLPPRPRVKKLPCVMSEEEVKRLFDGATNLKHKVFLKTVYSSGIRIGEAICLRPEHIESDPSRMMIRVEQGKGKKDRYTILSKYLLPELREYWRKYQPGEWLFPGSNRKKHIGSTGANAIFQRAKKKPVSPEAAVFTL